MTDPTDPTLLAFRAARALIADAGRWLQKNAACDAAENGVLPDDPTACRWCALAAVDHVVATKMRTKSGLPRPDARTIRANARKRLQTAVELLPPPIGMGLLVPRGSTPIGTTRRNIISVNDDRWQPSETAHANVPAVFDFAIERTAAAV